MADMCYECQFSDNGYFCRFMKHGVCTATSCKRMVEIEEQIALDICNLYNGGENHDKTRTVTYWCNRNGALRT